MPVYSVNRRRAIILLVLSSVLLLTLDLRGNPLIDRMRSAFSKALDPFETAADVVSTPIKNAWHRATDYQDLQRENERLRDQIAQQRGAELTARAIVSDFQELAALNGLVVNYLRVTARVVGGPPGNFEQTVEIDRGTDDGISVGMPVISSAGLVGKITRVYTDRSVVRLITDAEYSIECKVSAVEAEPEAPGVGVTTSTDETDGTTPSGFTEEELNSTTSTLPETSTSTTFAGQNIGNDDEEPIDADNTTTTTTVPGGTTTTSSTTATTLPEPVEREVGGCEGRGADKLPAMRFVTENPAFGSYGEGAIITTAGGSKSLAPPGLIVGEVINVVPRQTSAGPLLEIDLAADLDHLNFVQVLLYQPLTEVPDN